MYMYGMLDVCVWFDAVQYTQSCPLLVLEGKFIASHSLSQVFKMFSQTHAHLMVQIVYLTVVVGPACHSA